MYLITRFHSWFSDVDPINIRVEVTSKEYHTIDGEQVECYTTYFNPENNPTILDEWAYKTDKEELTEWITQPTFIPIDSKDIISINQ